MFLTPHLIPDETAHRAVGRAGGLEAHACSAGQLHPEHPLPPRLWPSCGRKQLACTSLPSLTALTRLVPAHRWRQVEHTGVLVNHALPVTVQPTYGVW